MIGEGSCNPVYLCHHNLTGAKVAIKVMETIKYQRLSYENQISEGQAMTLCQGNPNILKLIEEFQVSDRSFIVTKFCDGGDLINYLNAQDSEQLPESHAHRIFLQIANGVSKIHEAGIVHRDLKHLNIFFSDNSATPKV